MPSLRYAEDYLTTKVWALLHDPPDKAWLLCEGRDHEKHAVELFSKILRETAFGGGVPKDNIRKIVKMADVWASSFDRWLILHVKELSESVVCLHNILNIFNPRIRAYNQDQLTGPSQDIVDKFVSRLHSILKLLKEDPGLSYHVLYATLEYVWEYYTCPADTRVPTHTVFDHVYATATLVNWFLHAFADGSDEVKPDGYLVHVDIPGIQQFVNAARKTADYWAGSWLVSYLAWSTIEELVYVLGPDIMVLPTARHNLMYKQWLMRRVHEVGRDVYDRLHKLFSDWYKRTPCPVIPGTLTLLLPKLRDVKLEPDYSPVENYITKLNSVLSSSDELRTYIEEQFRRTWRRLVECISKLDESDILSKFVKRIYELNNDLRQSLVEDCPSAPRITIIDIGTVYNKYVSKEEEFLEGILTVEEIERLRKIAEGLREFDISERQVYEKLFYHILFTRILRNEILKERTKRIGLPVSATVLQFSEEKYRSSVCAYSESSSPNSLSASWRYCTVCGLRPAVLSFPRNENLYFQKICEILGQDVDRVKVKEYIRSVFKPGEHLCAVCFVKRILRLLVDKLQFDVDSKELDFDSNEYIANKYLVDKVLRPCYSKEVEREVYRSLERAICGGLSKEEIDEFLKKYSHLRLVKGDFSTDMAQIFGTSTNRLKLLVADRVEECLSKGNITLDEKQRLFLDSKCRAKLRMYYAIVKGDGDNLHRLIQGILPIKPRDYVRLVEECVKKCLRGRRAQEVYSKIVQTLAAIAEALGSTVLVSPVYHASLSAAMMVTAIKDIQTVRKLHGVVIYAGGDDIIALAPIETVLKIVKETRRNYWAVDSGIPGFHRLGSIIIPALVAYGRSYGVRIAHIMDPMQTEIDIATELLENYAKNAKWSTRDQEKDTLAVSYGRTTLGELEEVVKFPLSVQDLAKLDLAGLREVCRVVDTLESLWQGMLRGSISHNMPVDFDFMYRDVIKQGVDIDTTRAVLKMLIERNVRDKRMRNETLKCLLDIVEIRERGADSRSLVEYLLDALKILRGFPK